MGIEQNESGEGKSAAEVISKMNATEREALDYALNFIGETENSLTMADDQEAVVEVIEKIVSAATHAEAAKIAKNELEELL